MSPPDDGRALRVLAVTAFGTSAVTGGAEKWLVGMLEHITTVQWKVLLLQDGPFRAELEAAGVNVTVRPTGASGSAVASTALRVARMLKHLRPDVVVGNGVKAQLVTALAAMPSGTPTVWVKHDYSFDRTLARPLGCLASTVVATADEVGEAAGRPDTVVIYPPVQATRPRDRRSARLALHELGVPFDDRPILVLAGRLVPYKGVDDAIAALAAPGGHGWRLVIIGDDDHSAPGEGRRLVDLARQLQLSDRVTFLPPVPGLADLFAGFDALAVLTKPVGRRSPGREGFGMTAFEAMQAGIPVLAVAGSPVARRLAGRAGLIVAPGAPEEVALALSQLSDPSTRRRMGRAGQDLVRGYPGAAEAAQQFASVLQDTARKLPRTSQR